jgi:hypothetical protein
MQTHEKAAFLARSGFFRETLLGSVPRLRAAPASNISSV